MKPRDKRITGIPTIFRVLRPTVDGQPVVLLEPIKDTDTIHIDEGDEFITGTLNSDPWKATKPKDLRPDDDPSRWLGLPDEGMDGNRRART